MNLRVRHGLWLLKYKIRGASYVQREQAIRSYLDKISEMRAAEREIKPVQLAKAVAKDVPMDEKEPEKWDFTKLVLFFFGLAVLPLVIVFGLIAICLVILFVLLTLLLTIVLVIFLLISVAITVLGIFAFAVSFFVWYDWTSALFMLGGGLSLLCGGILLCMLTLSVGYKLSFWLRNRFVRSKKEGTT